MKLRNTAITLGIGAATATGLSLLKVNKDLVVGSTAVVVGAGLMIALKDKEDSNNSSGMLVGTELLEKVESLGDVSKSDLVRECGYVSTQKDGGERLNYTAFYEALLEAKKHFYESLSDDKSIDQDEEGDSQDDIEKYTKILEKNPNSSNAYNDRGYAKYEIGEYSEAIDDYNKALEINPGEASVHYNRAAAKSALGDESGSIDDFSKVIEINPKDADAYFNRGQAKLRLENYSEAIDDFSKAIEINPEDVDAYFNRGIAKRELGDHQGACEDWKKGGDLGDEESMNNYLNMKGSLDLIAEDNPPNDADAYYKRGVAKNNLGDTQGACEDWKKAAELGDLSAAKLVEEHCG